MSEIFTEVEKDIDQVGGDLRFHETIFKGIRTLNFLTCSKVMAIMRKDLRVQTNYIMDSHR